ncbi:MAG: penicillin-binding protein 1C [Pseudomonadota bacterium]
MRPLFSPRWRRVHTTLRRTALALGLAAAGLAGFQGWIGATRLPALEAPYSGVLLDKDGEVLRITLAADGRWRLPAGPGDVDAEYLAQLIAYEDKRFWSHGGVDPLALLRAGWQALRTGELRSGGSTLTMQVARLLEGSGTGRWAGKLRQMRVAIALERRLSKEEILAIYLTRAPFGGNLEGARAAARAYFGKSPRRLSAAEAAFLVALPQAPEARRPDRHPEAAKRGRDRVLARLAALGHLSQPDARRAAAFAPPAARMPMPDLAPHLGTRLARLRPDAGVLRTHIDADLQAGARAALRALLERRGAESRLTGAILIAEVATGKIRAAVSGRAYTDAARAGYLDMTRAVRSSGSTLKPFIYALAFEGGMAHPETLIDDRPMRFGAYAPQNFDGRYLGTISLRKALQTSRNIPAVAVLERVGPHQLSARLRRLGIGLEMPRGEAAGLAVALGGAGVTLEDLTTLYAALAAGGTAPPLHAAGAAPPLPAPLVGSVAAFYTRDILRGLQAPGRLGTGRVAYKTGTSYGHRDAWAIGFDGAHVVGIWLGRADGGAVPGLSGQEDAAPLLMRVFDALPGPPRAFPPAPDDALTLSQAQLPRPLQRFGAGVSGDAGGPEIASPPDGARVALSDAQRPALSVRLGPGGAAPFTWLVDGDVVHRSLRREDLHWPVAGPGFFTVTVIDRLGASARIRVELR